MRTSSILGSSTVARYATLDGRLTCRSADSKSSSVARSSDPLGRTSRSTAGHGSGDLRTERSRFRAGGRFAAFVGMTPRMVLADVVAAASEVVAKSQLTWWDWAEAAVVLAV